LQGKQASNRSSYIKRLYVALISLTALVLTVPWFFTDFSTEILMGFPIWAVYSLVATVLYAVLIAYLLGRSWDSVTNEDSSDERGEH